MRLVPSTAWHTARVDHFTSVVEGLFVPPYLNSLARGNATYLLSGATQYQFWCHGDDKTVVELELNPLTRPGVFTKVCSTSTHTNRQFLDPLQFY